MAVKMKRAYDKPAASDGLRVLVDRLWPRGLKKEDLKIDRWIRDVSPSTGLREWFQHDPAKWPEFRRRFLRELKCKAELVRELAEQAGQRTVTLVFAAKDAEHCNAEVLKEVIENRLHRGAARHED